MAPVTYCLDIPNHGKKGRIVHINLLKSWETPTAHALAVAEVPDGFSEDEGELVILELGGKEATICHVSRKRSHGIDCQIRKVCSGIPGLSVHKIQTGCARPVWTPPYRIPVAFLGKVREELKVMVENWESSNRPRVPGHHCLLQYEKRTAS